MLRVQEFVELWTTRRALPSVSVWRTRRFRVTDTPTALVGTCDWWAPFSDHDVPPGPCRSTISGWRFQASADDGETHVFDVERYGERWQLMRVFD